MTIQYKSKSKTKKHIITNHCTDLIIEDLTAYILTDEALSPFFQRIFEWVG